MIEVISINEADKWNAIVKSFVNYDVYYLSGYTNAYRIYGDGDPTLIYYHDQDISAINVVMKRDIEKDKRFAGKIKPNTFFDFSTPYGYGGFIVEGKINNESLNRLNNQYTQYCMNNNIICEFVRFHPLMEDALIRQSLYKTKEMGRTVTVDLLAKEKIWLSLSSKNRNVIRKAKKSGVEIYWGRSTELVEEFIPLYNSTMDRDSADSYYYFNKAFFKSILEDIKYNFLFFYAVYDEKIISMSIILLANKKMHYHLSASNRDYQKLAATNLLLYEVAVWGCENGYECFHLGGGLGGEEDSLFKFKKSFNKESTTSFSIGTKIFNQEKYSELLHIRFPEDIEISNTTFFPAYRK